MNGRAISSVSQVETINKVSQWNRVYSSHTVWSSCSQTDTPATVPAAPENANASPSVDASLDRILLCCRWWSWSRVRERYLGWQIMSCRRDSVRRGPLRLGNSSTWAKRMMLGSMWLGERWRVRRRRMQSLIPRRECDYKLPVFSLVNCALITAPKSNGSSPPSVSSAAATCTLSSAVDWNIKRSRSPSSSQCPGYFLLTSFRAFLLSTSNRFVFT